MEVLDFLDQYGLGIAAFGGLAMAGVMFLFLPKIPTNNLRQLHIDYLESVIADGTRKVKEAKEQLERLKQDEEIK
jgi:hypothetical protein